MQPNVTNAEESRIRAELERVLNSPDFAGSERHRRFLGYIVEETLAGRADRLKAYNIATAAFSRGADFDPQQDSIVRIEAGRLRRALDHFYLTEGRDHEIQITVPKGSYVPQFRFGGAPERAEAQAGRAAEAPCPRRRAPRIFVMPLEQEGESGAVPDFARGVTRQLIVALARFNTVHVYGAETSRQIGPLLKADPAQGGVTVDFILSGTVSLAEDAFALEVLLQETGTMRYVWTERFVRKPIPGSISMLRDEVAATVAQRLAQPFGILFSRALDDEGRAPESLDGYGAVLDFYQYIRSFRRDMFEATRQKLERAIEQDPTFGEGYACLSQIHTQSARFMSKDEPEVRRSVERALELARRALLLVPNSSNAHHALALAYWFSGDAVRSLEAYETAISLNPADTDLMSDMGLRCCLLMDWERGVPLIEDGYRRNPFQSANYRMGLVLYHFWEREYDEGLRQARLLDAPDVVYNHMAVAVCAVRAGQHDEARAAIAALEAVDPGYGGRVASDLARRNVHPLLAQELIAALREAGLGRAPRPAGLRRG